MKTINTIPRQADNLSRTDWFKPDIDPTIPGQYECSTLGDENGYVFPRRWNGECWVNSVTGMPTKVRMHWRGITPGSVEIGVYPSSIRLLLRGARVDGTDTLDNIADLKRDRAAQALYDETMTTP